VFQEPWNIFCVGKDYVLRSGGYRRGYFTGGTRDTLHRARNMAEKSFTDVSGTLEFFKVERNPRVYAIRREKDAIPPITLYILHSSSFMDLHLSIFIYPSLPSRMKAGISRSNRNECGRIPLQPLHTLQAHLSLVREAPRRPPCRRYPPVYPTVSPLKTQNKKRIGVGWRSWEARVVEGRGGRVEHGWRGGSSK